MKAKKVTAFILAAAVSVGMFAGCADRKTAGEGESLEMWCINYMNKYVSNYGEMECFKKIQENTGVNVKFIHPVVGQENEQFNVLIASGDLPDIIENDWNSRYSGGVEKAITDGIIIPIDEYFDTKAPNYKKVLDENPELSKSTFSTDGKQLLFHVLKEDYKMNTYIGPQIRKDWLDKLNLEVPTTIDEWYTVLKAFKEKDPNGNGEADEVPLADDKTMFFRHFAAAFGCLKGEFYENANGEFVYGSIEPEFKDFITEMNKWYQEGLLDNEFASSTRKNIDAKITTDISGAFIGYLGSQMGNYLAAKAEDENFDLIGTPWPVGPAGKAYCALPSVVRLVTYGYGSAITKDCKNIDAAIKFLDYCYSDEAYMLQNWGVEGVTYTKEGDSYQYTDLIVNNPEGKDPIQAMSPYAAPAYGGTKMLGAEPYMSFMYNLQQQKDAANLWAEGDNSLLIPSYAYTAEESKQISDIIADINTYEEEMFTKMIIGVVPISEFDTYVQKIKNMGIDDVIKLKKQAYDRYKKNQ